MEATPREGTANLSTTTSAEYAFWYGVALSTLPIPLLTFAFYIAAIPWFLEHNSTPAMQLAGYSLRAVNNNCELLIYGDSTALAGLDPSLIQSRTGLRTCNISEIKPVQDVVGVNFPLDQYLRHNKPPRFLVTGWHPPVLNLDHEVFLIPHEDGMRYALAYDRGLWLWKAMALHPQVTLNFLTWVLRAMEQDVLDRVTGRHKRVWQTDFRELRNANAGMTPLGGTPPQSCFEETNLDNPASSTQQDNEKQVRAFRARYGTSFTQVLVDVTPIPDCRLGISQIRQSLVGVIDNSLEILPLSQFSDHVHLMRPGAELFSTDVADQVLRLMTRDPKRPLNTPVAGSRLR